MTKPKVSIVMPSLNVADYIGVCVDSVINQTLKEIEIICVDAGSTDGTLEILQKYVLQDPRVKILHSDRKSYGYQVNLGMDIAQGDYLGIVETDDIVHLDMFRKLLTVAESTGVDVVKADFCTFEMVDGVFSPTEKKIAKENLYNRILTQEENYAEIITGASLYTWSGIYKMSFLRENGIRHNETPGASYQDNGFWFQTMCTAKSVYFLPESFYNLRRDNPNSSIMSKGKVYCIRDEYDYIKTYLDNHPELLRKALPFYWWARFGAYQYNYRRIAKEYRPEFLRHFSEVMRVPFENNELDPAMFSAKAWSELKLIVADPEKYLRKHKYEISRSQQNPAFLTRFRWCYEDNGLQYTLFHLLARILNRLGLKNGHGNH